MEKIKLVLVLFIILSSDLCITIPARSLEVGIAKCNQPLDRSGVYNTRPLLNATLASSLEGYDLKFADKFGEHLLKLKRNLIVDSAKTLGSDRGEWQLISYKAQPEPVKIQPNGKFKIEMWVSTRSVCLFDGNLRFLGDTKAKLFSGNRLNSRPIASLKNNYSKHLQNFILPGEYSVQFPKGWVLEKDLLSQVSGIPVVNIYSTKPDSLNNKDFNSFIKTTVYPVSASLEDMVQQSYIVSRSSYASKVTKRGNVILGGIEGYRIWREYNKKIDDRNEIETLLRHPAGTMIISSLYSSSNAESAIPLIQKIHGSYRRIK